jgi:hypothetical protein
MNGNKSATANSATAGDTQPPAVTNCLPAPDSIQAPSDTLVILHLTDVGSGVDATSVAISVNGTLVYTGDVASYTSAQGVCFRAGAKADYTYTYQQRATYGYGRKVTVAVEARDVAGNTMPERTYSFATEMYAFGTTKPVSVDQTIFAQGQPASMSDGQGNLWVVWQAGPVGRRQIYAACYTPDADTYNRSVQVSHSTGDHCNPAIAIDGTGTVYVVWQQNTSGKWDIYMATLGNWNTSSLRRVPDSTSGTTPTSLNRTNPVIAASRQPSGLVAIAWQDDRAGNQDIYVTRSTNRFETSLSYRVTSNSANQTNPAIAIDSLDTIVLVWTDARHGSTDIYGATSVGSTWANVPVVSAGSSQSSPKVVAGSSGHVLYLTWVDNASGNPDIFYARTDGLPTSPLTGVNIVDDTSGAAQQAPTIAAVAGPNGNDRVFICWEDGRNVRYSGKTELYFAEVGAGAIRANVPVDNDGIAGNQHNPALGLDRLGYPYVLWADDRNPTVQIYYAGVTYADPVPLVQAVLSASVGGTVGTSPSRIDTLNDVSVVIPAQACPCNATISIARIHNPQGYATPSLRQYEFGPSGLTFTQPVTITIPYSGSVSSTDKTLWFNTVTGAFGDPAVTSIQDLAVTSSLRALQFKTTHLVP